MTKTNFASRSLPWAVRQHGDELIFRVSVSPITHTCISVLKT